MNSSQSLQIPSKSSIHSGAIPITFPLLSIAPFETAPITPVDPPPNTRVCPLLAISSPNLYDSSVYLDFI